MRMTLKKYIKKGTWSEYHQVPPPMEENYTFYDSEKELATDTHLLPRGIRFESWGEQSTIKGSARQGYLLPGLGLSGGGLGGVIPSAVRGTVHYPPKVKKAINMVDQLSQNIDVTYTKSDVGVSELVKKCD
ncbi:hypothetical protein Hanom_Chr03g00225651 [Helianthus anomalus]